VRGGGILRAAIAMGQCLGMRVVAEGVETVIQAELLAELKCDELQGYLFSRPMPAGEVASYLDGLAARDVEGSPSPRDTRLAASDSAVDHGTDRKAA